MFIAPTGWNSAFQWKQASSVSGQHTASEQLWCSWKKITPNHPTKNQISFYIQTHCVCRWVYEWFLACPVQRYRWYSLLFLQNADEHILACFVGSRVFWLSGTPCFWDAENFKGDSKFPPSLWGSKVLAWVTSRETGNRTGIALHGTEEPLAFAMTQPRSSLQYRCETGAIWRRQEKKKRKISSNIYITWMLRHSSEVSFTLQGTSFFFLLNIQK